MFSNNMYVSVLLGCWLANRKNSRHLKIPALTAPKSLLLGTWSNREELRKYWQLVVVIVVALVVKIVMCTQRKHFGDFTAI